MPNHAPTKESSVAFFVLTFLLSVPFYILNALAYLNVVFEPEIGALYISVFTLTPIASASILTFRRSGWDGVKKLLGRIFVFMMPDRVILVAQVLTLVGTRVLAAWIFNNTGKSVFAAIVFHAADNTALVILPEIQAISPWAAVVNCGFVLVAAIVVTFLWGPRTLARFRSEG
jgi:hypothetical protein